MLDGRLHRTDWSEQTIQINFQLYALLNKNILFLSPKVHHFRTGEVELFFKVDPFDTEEEPRERREVLFLDFTVFSVMRE